MWLEREEKRRQELNDDEEEVAQEFPEKFVIVNKHFVFLWRLQKNSNGDGDEDVCEGLFEEHKENLFVTTDLTQHDFHFAKSSSILRTNAKCFFLSLQLIKVFFSVFVFVVTSHVVHVG